MCLSGDLLGHGRCYPLPIGYQASASAANEALALPRSFDSERGRLAMVKNRIRERITYREVMVDPGYMEKLTSACFLPHTDLARSPSVEKRLDGQRSRIATTSTQQR